MKSVLVDTNLLVLLIVGSVSLDEIARNKRTEKYDPSDHALLTAFLAQFQSIVITPNVASETSNLLDSLTGKHLDRGRKLLADGLRVWEEVYVESETASVLPQYYWLGLTDAAIISVSGRASHVITDDFKLYLELAKLQRPVTNYTHLKTSGWID